MFMPSDVMRRLLSLSMANLLLLMSAMWSLFCLAGCSGRDACVEANAMYYWRTTLKLTSAEREFLDDNEIGIIYLHLFDVVDAGGVLRPSSTLLFHDTLPAGLRIVPTVFIAPDALSGNAPSDSLGALIVRRADQMMAKNGYDVPDEIQIDFDWTRSNRDKYFRILESARGIMQMRGGRLSTTVRLHQLVQSAPPADYVVLMVYNVGNITDPRESNSILSSRTVRPYLKALSDYRLPLVTALPVYSWDVVFSGGKFKAIAHSLNTADTAMFAPMGDGRFRCRKYGPLAMAGRRGGIEGRIYPGDVVRHEFVEDSVLSAVLSDIRSVSRPVAERIVLYHLDEKSIKQYDAEFIQKLIGGSGAD